MKLSLEKTIIVFFALAVMALISALLIFDINNQKVKETGDLVEKTQSALNSGDKILLDVFDIVSSARGYALTGNEFFLEPYNKSIHTINRNIADLETILKDRPIQQVRIDSLKKLTAARLENSKNLIEVRKHSGLKEAEKTVTNLKGKLISDKIRTLITDINSDELLLLEQKKSENRKFQSNAGFIFIAIVVVIVLILSLVLVLIINNQKKRNKIETELKKSNELFFNLFNHNPAAIAITNFKAGKIINVNEALLELFEHTNKRELIGKTGFDLYQMVRPEQRAEMDILLKEKKAIKDFEIEVRAINGNLLWISTSVLILEIENTPCLLSVSINITERKKAEEALNEYKHFFNKSRDLSCIANMDGYFEILNPNFERVLGYSEKELLESKIINFIHPAFVDDTLLGIEKLKAGEPTISFVNRYRKKDGNYIWVDWSVTPNPETQKLYAIGRDITEKKTDELQLAITANLLNEAQSLAKIGNWDVNLITGKSTWSDEAFLLLGLDKNASEPSPELFCSTIHPEDLLFVKTKIQEIEYTHHAAQFNYRVLKKNGDVIYALSKAGFDFDEQGKAIRLYGIVQDITEIKIAQEKLIQSEINLQAIFENTTTGFLLMDTELTIISFNSRGDELAKVAFGQNLQMNGNLMKMLPTPRQKPMADQLNKMLKGETVTYEIPYLQSDGSTVWFSLTGKPVVDSKSAVTAISFAINDITERKKADEELSELKQEYERIFNTVSDGIHSIDNDGNIIFENLASAKMLGWDIKELIGKPAHATIHHTRADGTAYPKSKCKIYATLYDGIIRQIEDEVFWRKDGTSFPVAYTSAPKLNEKGEIIGSIVTFRDITERKKAVKQLEESEEKFRQFINLAPVGIALSSLKGEVLEVNQTMIDMVGLKSKKEFINTPSEEFYINKNEWPPLIDLLKKNGIVKDFELRMRRQNAQPIWVSTNLVPFKLANGEGGILSATINITEQKKQKEEIIQFTNHLEQKIKERTVELSKSVEVLKHKEEQLEETSSLAKVGGWEIDLSTMVVRWTDEVFRIHELEEGNAPPVAEGINYYAPEARPVIQEAVNKAIATGEGWDLELPFITAKGNHLWVRAKGSAEMKDGKAIRVYGVFQDITERKNAKLKLIQQNAELILNSAKTLRNI